MRYWTGDYIVLISHICRFIYLKTRKTAGTSVEIYFEPYCVGPRNYAGEQHERKEEVSDCGVVGARRQVSPSDRWYNHMPAHEVRSLLGSEKWDSYFKFCVVRNPYDKVVSYFWHDLDRVSREKHCSADFASVRRAFTDWTKLDRFPVDTQIYVLQGDPVVDDFIRYERLSEDMERICSHLKVQRPVLSRITLGLFGGLAEQMHRLPIGVKLHCHLQQRLHQVRLDFFDPALPNAAFGILQPPVEQLPVVFSNRNHALGYPEKVSLLLKCAHPIDVAIQSSFERLHNSRRVAPIPQRPRSA